MNRVAIGVTRWAATGARFSMASLGSIRMLTPRQQTLDGVTVVFFDDGPHSLHEASVDELQDPMLAAGLAEPPLVVVDLSQVEFFGSSFIELLFRVWKRIQDRSGQFALCCLSEYCQEVLAVTNLDKLWQNYETREQAIAALTSPQPSPIASEADAD